MVNILKVLDNRIGDGYLPQRAAVFLSDIDRIVLCSRSRSEARHRNAYDTLAVQPEFIESVYRNNKGQCRIQAAGKTDHRLLAVNGLKPCIKTCRLHVKDVFTSCFKVRNVLGNERSLADISFELNVREFGVELDHIDAAVSVNIVNEGIAPSSVCFKTLKIDVRIKDRIIIRLIRKSLALG